MSLYLSSPRVWILLICQPYYTTLSAHFPACERSGNADVPHCRCDFSFCHTPFGNPERVTVRAYAATADEAPGYRFVLLPEQ